MKSLIDNITTKSKDFENTVSIVTTGAAAGITLAKAIKRNETVGAIVGIGASLLIYSLFKPQKKLKKINQKLELQIKERETKFEK